MIKNFALPQQVIDCLNFFAPADRGEAFTALFNYINKGILPGDDISPAARGAFEFARVTIDPIIERRKRAAEKRMQRKAAKYAADCEIKADSESNAIVMEGNRTANDVADRNDIINEHIRKMNKVVLLAQKACSTNALRDKKIREELNRRYPGQYSDILYDRNGVIELVAAV